MTEWIPLLYDLCVVILVIYFISISARRGFVRTVIEFIGYLISFFIANLGANAFSTVIFNNFLRPSVVETVGNKLTEAGITDIAADVQTVLSQVPDALEKFLDTFGSGTDMLAELESLSNSTQPLPEAITDHVVAPLVISIVQLILFIVLMSICLFLVRKFAWTLSGLRRIPIIGPANTLLGGVVGAFEGLLTVVLIANLLSLIIAATAGGFAYLNNDIMEQTVLLRRFLI